ncbi:hypothetical protein BO70DRAFT_426672 [Aspergillus heteromorphus CBS 117.55]|uniref:Urease accessory protein UreD n=1 Tax=Aspergillus heteromorphus CBS 117.55 TaxID=1448321 RepID=A0A317WRC8_9EURO|nr:uncharacterized protein BO70DRAFT_426672 [Aspergillus heteromorphus CBS 117.55]PWY88996.1 hypothetical protein BO70DRAFT_426672 [Aspergillus heteromorphus CBS 117.55]
MPHKHKRRQNDASAYNLPPSVIAKPLPVHDPRAAKAGKGKGPNNNNNNKKNPAAKPKPDAKEASTTTKPKPTSGTTNQWADDTPRAFRRLMQFQNPKPTPTNTSESSNNNNNKKRKRNATQDDTTTTTTTNSRKKKTPATEPTTTTTSTSTSTPSDPPIAAPQILPGEKLSDFAARVDREMPLSHMKRTHKPEDPSLPKIRESRVTKHEKHLKRLQAQWRKDDKEILEREALEREERAEEMDEQLALWETWKAEAGQGRAKKKGGAGGGMVRKGGNVKKKDADADPWAKLKKRDRLAKRAVNPLDVVQAPPQLTRPREIFKVRGGARVDVANVPAAGGSLRRREELAAERKNIVEEYRRLMAEKRGRVEA